jgi:anti-sigma regulatory factor (Ser/Thr protein kinase)
MQSDGGFRHEAVFYEGSRGFTDWVVPFISTQLASGAIVLVMADAARTAMVREQLGYGTRWLRFEDAEALGTNPARLMPRWTDFAAEALGNGRRLVGIGALRYARTPAERAEAQLHEALLNVAFAQGAPWRLVCPYDVAADPDDLEEARRTHPSIVEGERVLPSGMYLGLGAAALTLIEPLSKPPAGAAELPFGQEELAGVRDFLRGHLGESALPSVRVNDLLLAAHEAATNCVRHGGGSGRVHLWREDATVVCDVVGNGRITDPLAGRRRPDPRHGGGLGLWIVNQVCDLVQIRSGDEGTTVRMFMQTAA